MDEIERLWQLYEQYKQTAEQHEFPTLLFYDSLLVPGYEDLKKHPSEDHERIFKTGLEQVLTRLGVKLHESD